MPMTDNDLYNDDLKRKLKVTLNGYGEKRNIRFNTLLEPTIRAKAVAKCDRMGISLTEAINQLLYIWAKDEVIEPDKKQDKEQTSLFNGE